MKVHDFFAEIPGWIQAEVSEKPKDRKLTDPKLIPIPNKE